MSQVRIQVPPGVEVDKTRLTSAVRFAMQGCDPGKMWRQNDVPAIAQLEEATYTEGRNDLADLYEEVVAGLGLPPDQQAMAVLQKGLGLVTLASTETALLAPEEALLPPISAETLTQEQAVEIHDQLAKAFRSEPAEPSPLERRITAATEEYANWAAEFDSLVADLNKSLETAETPEERFHLNQEMAEGHEKAAAVWLRHREMIDAIYDEMID